MEEDQNLSEPQSSEDLTAALREMELRETTVSFGISKNGFLKKVETSKLNRFRLDK